MSTPCRLTSSQIASLSQVDAAAWNALAGDNPLLQHEFLVAMETSGCVGSGTAWQGCHLLLRDENEKLSRANVL